MGTASFRGHRCGVWGRVAGQTIIGLTPLPHPGWRTVHQPGPGACPLLLRAPFARVVPGHSHVRTPAPVLATCYYIFEYTYNVLTLETSPCPTLTPSTGSEVYFSMGGGGGEGGNEPLIFHAGLAKGTQEGRRRI